MGPLIPLTLLIFAAAFVALLLRLPPRAKVRALSVVAFVQSLALGWLLWGAAMRTI